MLCLASSAIAEEKNWSGAGQSNSWFDDGNWVTDSYPTLSDDVFLNLENAFADVGNSFGAKTLTIGGNVPSTITVENFISGTVVPESVNNIAVLNGYGGHLNLKGSAGKITLKGTYKDSEQLSVDEPSLVFYVS